MSAQTAPRQLSLTEAVRQAGQDSAAVEETEDGPHDDRVVGDALTCACGRPAGADGQCTACRREYDGHAIGNHGGRL